MPDQQPDHASGSVPHAYRNALYWRWAKDLPRPLRGGFVTTLYALATAANTHGVLRMRDGRPIRVQSVAAAACSDLKDVRRWLTAAEAAGVVTTEQAPRRGTPTVYVLVISPRPDWSAAVASLESTRRVRPKKDPAPWPEPEATELGGPAPQVPPQSSGDRPPNSGEGDWGDRPPNELGGPAPFEMGGPAPQRPRGTHELPQEEADAGGQPPLGDAPQGAGEPADADPHPPPEARPPQLTLTTQGRRDARAAQAKAKSASSQGQRPLLLPVRDPEHVATKTALREAAEQDPEAVRRAIRDLGQAGAIDLYGWRLVAPHIAGHTDTA